MPQLLDQGLTPAPPGGPTPYPEGWDVPGVLKPPPAAPPPAKPMYRFSDPLASPVPTTPPPWKATDFPMRFGHVDSVTNGVLPTSHVLALGESDLRDADLQRAARMLARQYDLQPSWFLQRYAGTTDAYLGPHGEVITGQQARTLLRPQEPKVLLEMLRNIAGPDERIDVMPTGRKREQYTVTRPEVKTVAKVIDALLSSHLSGQMSLATTLGVAAQIASRLESVKGGVKNFAANMAALRGQDTGHWSVLVGIAEDGAVKGQAFASAADALSRYGTPGVKGSTGGMSPDEFRKRIRESSLQGIPMRVYQGAYFFFDPIGMKWTPLPQELQASAVAAIEVPGSNVVRTAPVRVTTPPDTWGMPANLATKYGGDGVYRPPMPNDIAAMGFVPGVGGFDLRRPQDYYKQARQMANQAEIDKSAFQHSVLGWTLGRVGDAANFLFRYTEAGVLRVAQFGAYPINLLGGTEVANRHFWQDEQAIDDIKNGKETLGGLVADSLDLPKSAGTIFDLTFAIGADPFMIGGRLIKGMRAGRSLIELGEVYRGGMGSRITNKVLGRSAGIEAKISEQWAKSVGAALFKPRRLWQGKSLVRFATETAWDAKRPLYNVVSERARTLLRVEGIDPELARKVEQAVTLAKRGGLTIDQAEAKVGDLFLAGTGAKALDKTFSGDLLHQLDQLQAERITQVGSLAKTLKLSEPETLKALEQEFARYDHDVAQGILNEVDHSFTPGRILQLELPYRSQTMRFRLAANRLAGDTYLGRGVRALTTRIPTPLTDFEGGHFAEQLSRKLRRSRVFPQKGEVSIESITAQARKLAEATNPNREHSMVRLLEGVQRETWKRIAGEYGLPTKASRELYARLQVEIDKANHANGEAYGVRFMRDANTGEISMTAAQRPLYETQLLNGYYTADPVLMRKAIRDAIGFRQSVMQAVRHLSLDIPSEELALARQSMTAREKWIEQLTRKAKSVPLSKINTEPTLADWAENVWQWFAHEHFTRYWKAAQVIRPGYILRVPAGDEQIRALLDLGIASRVRGQAVVGKNVERLANRGLLPRGWAEHTVTLPTTDGVGYDVKFRIPGALPNEAYADSKAGFGQVWESVAEQMRQVTKGVEQRSWGIVEPSAGLKKWSRAWNHAVNGQLAHGSVGRMALEDVASGVDASTSIARIEHFLTNDRLGQSVASRMGYDAAELRDWAEEAVDTARRYTMTDPRIAEAALRGQADSGMLRALVKNDVEKLPPVHGMKAEMVSGKSNPIKPVVDAAARAILQEPTNHLSRQPFFKAWFDRILKAQVQNAVNSGVAYKDAAEAEHALAAMEATARRFALDRVRKVMFDLRDQSRLAELLGFVSPFFQPFQEAFSVYGHLIRRNPALIGWARTAWKAATDSGFIQKDDTGQYVVPLTVFGKMAGLLTMTGFHPGFHLTAPLQSFNLFFNNAFPIPTGKLAGDLSVPMPGLSPPLMWLAQKFIKDEDSSRLSNWAYQYGPEGLQSLLPTWVNNAITSLDPSWNKNGYTAYVDDFMRLNQMQGVKFASKEEQVKAAEDQAKAFYRWKAGISLISPAGPTIKFPTEALDNEFRDLVQRYTAEGKTWSDARDEFIKRHPDQWLTTIGKTVWEGHDPGLPGNIQSPSIPANQLADRILSQPGFKEFAKKYPAMAFAILPQAAFAMKEYSPDVFRKQLAKTRRYLSPTEFAAAGESAQGWSAYWHERDAWDAWTEAHPNTPENSIEFQTRKQQFDDSIIDLRTRYPAFDDDFGSFGEGKTDPRVMAYMRAVAGDKVLADFPVGKALNSYLKARDGLEKRMSAKGITTIDSVSAAQSGLGPEYTAMVANLEKRYPDFSRVYDTFLRDDLMSVRAAGDKALNGLDPQTRTRVYAWETRMNDLRKQIDLAPTDLERSKLYGEEAKWIDSAYRDYGATNPVSLWFRSQDYQTRKRITQSVQTKPYIFLNRYEKTEVLHEPTDNYSEDVWQQVADARVLIAQRSAQDPNFNASAAYASLDGYVQSAAKDHPVLATQVAHANEWGWAFWTHSDLPTAVGPSGDAWRNLRSSLQQVEMWAIKNGLHGSVGSKEQQVQWNGVKSAVLEYVNQLGAWSPTFKRQWQDIDSNYSGNLIDVMMPEVFFAIGAGSK